MSLCCCSAGSLADQSPPPELQEEGEEIAAAVDLVGVAAVADLPGADRIGLAAAVALVLSWEASEVQNLGPEDHLVELVLSSVDEEAEPYHQGPSVVVVSLVVADHVGHGIQTHLVGLVEALEEAE